MTAYWGVWGGLAVLLGVLGSIVFLLHKEKGKWALGLGLVLIIAIPIWLDRLILHCWYVIIPLESARSPAEWMDFLGGYLGVVGTIVAGALAYWQTKVNRQQDKQIADLQSQIAVYQILPAIHFREGILKVYTDELQRQMNKSMYDQLYYSICGRELTQDVSSFVYINIQFQEKGVIPIEKVLIKEIRWSIDNNAYIVKLKKTKYVITGEKLLILIDSLDDITKEDSGENAGEDFIHKMIIHQEYYVTGDYNNEKSCLLVNLQFENQIGKISDFALSYYIYSDREAEQLQLRNPHVDTDNREDRG